MCLFPGISPQIWIIEKEIQCDIIARNVPVRKNRMTGFLLDNLKRTIVKCNR